MSKPLGYEFQVLTAIVFIVMAISTCASAASLKVSFILAPGVGVATLLAHAYAQGKEPIVLVSATVIASIIAYFLSKSVSENISYRQKFLDKLPEPIKIGVKAGIGTLLASVALCQVQAPPVVSNITRLEYFIEPNKPGINFTPILIFVVFTFILILFEIISESTTTKNSKLPISFTLFYTRLTRIASPLLIFIILCKAGSISFPLEVSNDFFLHNITNLFSVLTLSTHLGQNIKPLDIFLLIVALSGIICFIFIIDIPGSPYDMLKKHFKDDYSEIFDKSFRIASISSMISSFFGLSTSVYYAENNIIIQASEDSNEKKHIDNFLTKPGIAFFCSFFLFIIGVFFLFCKINGNSYKDLHSLIKFAVAPNLFCLGVHLTSKSLIPENTKNTENYSSIFYAPASLIILLIGNIGFEFSVPLGIIYYCIISHKYRSIYFWGSVLSLAFLCLVRIRFIS
ncbi:hypothetical protein [Desulforegula conservatrix]|uniref:hypothetical protein n=1 Tax=Desulforegula conservatrix TaxID=153026 RepID=UPI00048155CA|nr:hypothetical protein [Desulforegula conservatrix]